MLRQRLQGMTSDLRNRLLLLLVLPLCTAGAAGRLDGLPLGRRTPCGTTSACLRLLPALADSVLAPGVGESRPGDG
jgi:two-component system sensor histidine kinase TctE